MVRCPRIEMVEERLFEGGVGPSLIEPSWPRLAFGSMDDHLGVDTRVIDLP